MITDVRENEIMDAFNKIIPYLKVFFEDDVTSAIYNTKKSLIFNVTENIPLVHNLGDEIPKGSAAYKAIKEGEIVKKVINKEVFGVPIKAIAIPIKDNKKEIIGCIGISKSLQRQTEIKDLSENVSTSLEQISLSLEQISLGIQEAGKASENILINVKDTSKKTRDTDSILDFVINVAKKTNLLGLNAAIESSRAGEAGAGFSVVAKEIRKLSNSSGESIKKIENVIREIQNSILSITNNVDQVNQVFQEQAAAIEEIMASVQELNETTKKLEEMSSKF